MDGALDELSGMGCGGVSETVDENSTLTIPMFDSEILYTSIQHFAGIKVDKYGDAREQVSRFVETATTMKWMC